MKDLIPIKDQKKKVEPNDVKYDAIKSEEKKDPNPVKTELL